MKVRPRSWRADPSRRIILFDVIEESPSFYIAKRIVPQEYEPEVLEKADYEPVPEKTWRDVTAELVEWGKDQQTFQHNTLCVLGILVDGYRIRTVQRYEYPTKICTPTDVVIIEKEEP